MSVVLFIVCTFLGLALGSGDISQFAPFGPSNGDTTGYACDDCSYGPIVFDFVFYGVDQASLYVNNNGLISFGQGISSFTPVGMSGANFPAIAPYWADVYTVSDGSDGYVYYRSSTDPNLLATWSAKVSSTFQGTRMFIATWDNVGYYYNHHDKVDSFQAVLIADNLGNSWVFLNYGSLQWTTGDASGGNDGVGGTPASVGFSNGHGTYVQTSASLTANVVNTQNFLTQVNQVVVVLPPAPPAQTCGNGIVEGTEQCDSTPCCTSTCTFATTSTVCRPSAGSCDAAETCTGSSGSCPADSMMPSTTMCRPTAGSCQMNAMCDGVTATCPANPMMSSTTVCRPSAGSCDVAETCTGTSASCPADSMMSSSTVCRPSAGSCDVAETCSGTSATCPADSYQPSTYVCRPAVNNCDIAESCTGTSATCPPDALSMTAPCVCSREAVAQNITGYLAYPQYFCTGTQSSTFYQCVYGVFLPQSAIMHCAPGTSCGCPVGTECSCDATRSPCVLTGQSQSC